MFAFWIFFVALLGSFLYTGYESSFNKENRLNIIAETITHAQKDVEQEKALPILNEKVVYNDSLNIRSNQSNQFIIDNKRLGGKKITYKITGNISVKSNLELNKTADADNALVNNQNPDIKLQKNDTKELSAEQNEMGNPVSLSSANVENEGLKKEENSSFKTAIVSIESDDKLSIIKISDTSFSDKKK